MKAKWTQTGTRFNSGWQSRFGVQPTLYSCSHELRRNETQNGMDFISVILTEIKFQTDMRFSWEHNLPETKWISADSLEVAINAHVRLKLNAGIGFISVTLTEMSCKHYLKWKCLHMSIKISVALKCSRNETSCEQNLLSRRFELSNWYEFISPLMWMY